MKNELHINNDLQMLTTTQMSEIWGGDVIDVNEFPSGIMETELPKLPNLPASMPANNTPPVYINQ